MSDTSEPLRVVMVTSDLARDIDEGLEIEGGPTVILQGGIEAVKAAARHFGESVTVSAAPTYTDLARAWEAGRDDVLTFLDVLTLLQVASIKGGIIELANVGPAIRAMTPPADLAERVKGGGV